MGSSLSSVSAAPKVAPGSNLAATAASDGSAVFVYYQNTSGGVLESRFDGQKWTGGASSPAIFQAAPYTPLAAISWDNGIHRRIYYLDEHYTVREFCCDFGKWQIGHNFADSFQAAPHTSLAAVCWTDEADHPHIRLYCQSTSLNILELRSDGPTGWEASSALSPALDGTSIAAVVCYFQSNPLIRVYCQVDDLTLREYCWDGVTSSGWYIGGFGPGTAPACTPIAALGRYNDGIFLQVYWMSTSRKVIQANITPQSGQWEYNNEVVPGPLPSYTKIAAGQSNNGKTLRLYYQLGNTSILETRNDGGSWGKGSPVQAQT